MNFKKALFLIFVTLSCASSFQSQINANSLSKIKHYYDKLILNPLEKFLGIEDASQEDKDFINDIAKKMGYTRPIRIKKFSSMQTSGFGYANAFATESLTDAYVFVSEYFLKQLDQDEKTFLIGHELTHLQNHHIRKKFASMLSISALISGYITYEILAGYHFLNNKEPKDKASKALDLCFQHIMPTIATGLLLDDWVSNSLKESRKLEYEADRESALKLDAAKGGISLMKSFGALEALRGIHTKEKYASHPSTANRIKALQKILDKKNLNSSKETKA